ncbi:ras GTPase-activating protein raskol [Uranotaenia lowii]|uniref:ras GTPase-activating protein raskol n=1 Tax=Uranotaenia lowii TaxID=190385 RepID=UPI0024799E48|nr:ras GTPase-activating protein raskol [Uranotaenia lowii]XP_055592547.1 ras GTPase-activating protein raskol [Uranotaenia lowii]
MLQAADTSFASTESSRRRSTFYVPLTSDHSCQHHEDDAGAPQEVISSTPGRPTDEYQKRSLERIYNPDLSACSFEWSLDDSLNSSNNMLVSSERENKLKRYGIVLNASVNIDDDETTCHQKQSNTSTPIRLMKSRSRNNILNLPEKPSLLVPSPAKEKSKTLPQNMSPANTFPPKSSFLLKSTPKISLNYSSDAGGGGGTGALNSSAHSTDLNCSPHSALSPKKSLSFIRRTHSTKLSRSNSLLKSLTSKCVDQSIDCLNMRKITVKELDFARLEKFVRAGEKAEEMARDFLVSGKDDKEEESAVHSDTSYEKACRRGSAPSTPILGQKSESTSRFTNFFSKRSFRSNPLKRTKSVTKLERSKRGQGGLRGSRSHESLLSNHAVMSTIDLSCIGAIGVVPVHASVLGRRHCFQVRGGPRGERYYSCGSRQERDLWIYSLRKSIAPNAENSRRTDNSLKMWVYEAKALPPKKKYFCEIYLDKTLYGRTSVKLRTELLFWGEYFDFPDVPDINVITVNVYREGEKKKKRDKHALVGCVKIPIHEVTSRTFSEDWYPIMTEKHDSISKNSSKEPIPTLRIKCRFQSIDILPLGVYKEFLDYLKENYKKVCEILEPVIGVKAKEDIGQALVLLMHAQGMAAAFLTDVVALDLLRVGDQRLTFRGNSLATKSMEAFLKLTGEQYLQDTLSTPISEIISSDRDCEVDPLKANGSLSRQQQALRNAVKSAWNSIAESSKNFPTQLRDCFSTFRERLQLLDREDMADNLISASIFLRFLCPAILSPSLFNITNELPSARATRNLTLVAKTLQTLANFTRFQGKENFMEFLNDFLEQEAPRMKQFLHDISTRSDCPSQESILDWAGYIDQGKQLSILHTLLAESIQKLPSTKQVELHPLCNILESITIAKETNNFITNQQQPSPQPHPNQENQQNNLVIAQIKPTAERGIIRGVLTPTSLEKNIFRYNDPTVRPLLNQSQQGNPLQHSHSTSSINSTSNLHVMLSGSNNSSAIQHQSVSSTNSNANENKYQYQIGNVRNYGISTQYYNNASNIGSLKTEKEKSPVLNCGIRASTLPRNNAVTVSNTNINGGEQEDHGNGSNLIQIGFDPSNPFNRKSPTPLLKSSTHINGSRSRNLNGSQLSLISDIGKNPLSLGIPHSEMVTSSTPNAHQGSNPSNMPMSLDDLEDLLNYADEQNIENQKGKDQLQSKGSNISIGQISNICSSGYQSITTQSQSSSPIELGQQQIEYVANKVPPPRKVSSSKYGFINQRYNGVGNQSANLNCNLNNNNNNDLPPYKSPLYHHATSNGNANSALNAYNNNLIIGSNGNGTTNGSSTLIGGVGSGGIYKSHLSTIGSGGNLHTSSSDERLSNNDNYRELDSLTVDNGNGYDSFVGLNGGRRLGSSRMPRTNPLMQYKREEPIPNFSTGMNSSRDHYHHNSSSSGGTNGRYQRRMSIDSGRTLSDSSTDTESGGGKPHHPVSSSHHAVSGHHANNSSGMVTISGANGAVVGVSVSGSDSKRRHHRTSASKSVEQCEREIQRLQASVDELRQKLEESELKDVVDDLEAISHHSDTKIRSIIGRLLAMEEELRREQYKMSLVLSHKQRVIEAQGQQIAALDAANNRLLTALSSLRNRYENQSTTSEASSPQPNASASSC